MKRQSIRHIGIAICTDADFRSMKSNVGLRDSRVKIEKPQQDK